MSQTVKERMINDVSCFYMLISNLILKFLIGFKVFVY